MVRVAMRRPTDALIPVLVALAIALALGSASNAATAEEPQATESLDHAGSFAEASIRSMAPESPAAEASPAPTTPADASVFIDALCLAVDELFVAVGNPDTGEASELSQALEEAIVRGDTTLIDMTAEAMLGRLQASRTAAARAASYPPAAVGMGAFDDFVVIVADGVAARRDAAPDGLDAARVAADSYSGRAYASWRMWITELAPIGFEVAGDMPIPCPPPGRR